MIFTESMIR